MTQLEYGGRRSGRTWHQLERLPDGAIYLVPSHKIADYCRGLLRKMGRRVHGIRFATPDNFLAFTGARGPVDVDHAYFEVVSSRRAREAYAFIQLCAPRQR